ncbi:MAG TPA: L,D-transpeptidase family protein [Thermodesulfovibrionales bacterium]|nr:L,D-transpeptidase family protein [Thermodesulfovibrionales bacterium]
MVLFISVRIRDFFLAVCLIFVLAPRLDAASSYSYGKGNMVIGEVQTYEVEGDESLIEIARDFDVGYNQIESANPTLDPFVPGEEALVTVPTSWILPELISYDGIVINISEMRLYYFHKMNRSPVVTTYPIGIGSEGNDTPVGVFKIIQKIVDPPWYPPPSIRKERPELPKVIPPGPDNPLGSHALRLSLGTVLIHGTNRPFAVGRKVTHGCIRLYPEDIPQLFSVIPVGMKVTIVRQPIKVGVRDKKVYLEVHKDDYRQKVDYFNEAVKLLRKKGLLKDVNTEKIYQAVQEKQGFPVEINQ